MVKRVIKKTITEKIDEEGNKETIVKESPEKVVEKKPRQTKRRMTAREREELLIENFVGLQHAMTNLSIKFSALSDNITRLLQVFEEAARNFMEGGRPDDKEMINKINSLLEQNKTIARGLLLMEEKLRVRNEPMPESIRYPLLNREKQESNNQNQEFTQRTKPLPTI